MVCVDADKYNDAGSPAWQQDVCGSLHVICGNHSFNV